MDERAYLVGFLTTTAILLVEHLACANRIVPTGDPLDWRLFARYVLGVLGILAGCAATRTLNPTADPLATPLLCSAAGGWIVAIAGWRRLYRAALAEAETRGWLKGLADKE